MTIRYGLVGSGMMGQEHIRNVALLDGVTVTAVSDPDETMRRTAAELAGDATAYADHRALLAAETCDAFVVASPNDTHHDVMVDLIEAGRPILCEKPLCTTTDDCRDLQARADKAGTPVWVAMEYRYMPPMQRLLAEAVAGTAGDIKMMAIREHRYPFLKKVGDWNRFSRRTGGTLVEKCCHFWDLMRLTLRADPVRVYASAGIAVNHLDEAYEGETPDIIDHGFVVIDFANGTRGMLDLCMFAEGSGWQEVISVTGPKARIDACVPGPTRFANEHRTACLVIADRESKSERTEPVPIDEDLLAAGDHHGSTFFQHEKFLDMVRTGSGTPEVSLADGLWAVRVGEAAEQSARSGEPVTFAEES